MHALLSAHRRTKLFSILALALLVLSSLLFIQPVSAAPKTPKINWSPCYKEFGVFECGILHVPLDHSARNGATINIAVIKKPAADPARRIGSLVFNPGGPGGSGVDFVLFAGEFLYTPEVRARFDFIGFDPRGVWRSTPLRCFGNLNQSIDAFGVPFPYPTTPAEEAAWEAADRRLVDACVQRGGRILNFMSTADVVRDLDLLRQALGERQLTFAGYSYGSFLGVTYANLFPRNVRAMVVDGVLDPIAWTTGTGDAASVPFSTRLRSDQGAAATLNEFFRLCDSGAAQCAFSGNSAERFAALAARLRAQPLTIVNPDGSSFQFTEAFLIANALGAMYDSFSWPAFAEFLAALEMAATPQQLGLKLEAFRGAIGLVTKRGFPNYPNFAEGFQGVACADSDNPRTYAAWSASAAEAAAQYGYFGPIWTWISSPCAVWPGPAAGRYTGPWSNTTANPVLVVGNYYDPATRYEGAQTVAALLPNSRLLSLNGWGHVSLFLSACADEAVSRYLLDLTLPPPGAVCNQDVVPFATGAALASRGSPDFRARFTGMVLPDIVRKSGR